ncbi:Ribosomal protein S13-like, H2TH, partial [Sesbania bispinosa]
KYISGIGNWVADEVLYQARIHPQQIASSLSKESCSTLHKCIKEVIEKAVEVGADSSQFPTSWIFHSREKKPDKAFVDGKKIDFITAGGQDNCFRARVAKLSGSLDVKGTGKPKRQTSKKTSVDDDNKDDIEKPTIGEGENMGSLKSKKGTKAGAKGRKPSKGKSLRKVMMTLVLITMMIVIKLKRRNQANKLGERNNRRKEFKAIKIVEVIE